jgi:hypothetical protein
VTASRNDADDGALDDALDGGAFDDVPTAGPGSHRPADHRSAP